MPNAPLNKVNFSKYIPIDTSGFKGIFAAHIFIDMNVLKMKLTLSQIRNYSLFDKIVDGLNKNPENSNLVNIIDSELVFKRELSQIEMIAIKQAFEFKLNEYVKVHSGQIGQTIALHNIIPGLNNLNLRYEHTYILYTFMKFFIEEYEMIKISLNPNNSSSKAEQPKDVELAEEKAVVAKYNKSKGCGGIFLEMMGIVHSQAVRTFIARNLFNKHWDLDTAVLIDNKDGNISIKHHPLYDFNVWQYSEIHDHELVNLLESLPENSDFEIADKLKKITKQLIYIIFNKEALIKQNHSKYIFTISVGLFLMYIYSLKMNSHHFISNVYTASTRNSKTYLVMLDYAFKYVLDKFDVHTNSIISIVVGYSDGEIADGSFNPMTAKLDRIFEQYQYLAAIDQDEFLSAVFSDFNSSIGSSKKTEPSQINKDLELSVGVGCIISLDTFISDKSFDPSELTPEYIFKQIPSSLLDYVEIPLNDMFKTNRIISYLYAQLLYIRFNGVNKKFVELDSYVHPILKRYCDIIINDIFKAIDSNPTLAQNTSSAFQIYSQFVAPFIRNESITSYVSLMILYQVVIPYICDNFKIEQFVDNFH